MSIGAPIVLACYNLPKARIHLRCEDDHQIILTSISTRSSPFPMSFHLKMLKQYWVKVGWSKKNIVMIVTHKYRLNLNESYINASLNPIAADPISKIGINPITVILRNAILSNLSVDFVSISNQSKDKSTPDEPPTCLTPVNASDMYVGKFKLKDSAIDKICK